MALPPGLLVKLAQASKEADPANGGSGRVEVAREDISALLAHLEETQRTAAVPAPDRTKPIRDIATAMEEYAERFEKGHSEDGTSAVILAQVPQYLRDRAKDLRRVPA